MTSRSLHSRPGPVAVLALLGACIGVLAGPQAASGQDPSASPESVEERPRPAVAPLLAMPTQTVDSQGQVTIRAVRLSAPLSVDGRLDEAVYQMVPPADRWIQQEPFEGEPGTERTEAWIFFDEENVYVSVRAWDSEPGRTIANELRRDVNQTQGDNIAVVFDTFHDRRNGFYFQTNPLGAIRDQEVTNEGNQNPDWNTVWDARSARIEHGWTVEMVIPFRSLRYAGAGPQEWGVNIRRSITWKNEEVFLTRIPASYGLMGIYIFSRHATLVGLETPPPPPVNVEVKPYATSGLSTDRSAEEPFSNRRTGDVGFDVKYGMTSSLTLDLTVNTDFAQVEADEEQVNLTRFNLSLPEKRDFFLEGRGIFAFGTGGGGGGGGGGDVPVMFFSRQIGLSSGKNVPVRGGARLTGRVGPYTVGAVHVQTGRSSDGSVPSTDFSVLRLKRDVLSRSSIALIATHRTPSIGDGGVNNALGFDATFPFHTDWEILSYYARTWSEGRTGNEASYRAQVAHNGDRYGLQLGYMMVGDDFNPEIGFLRRRDFRQSSAMLRFSPRVPSIPSIRRLVWQASGEHVSDEARTFVDSRDLQGQFQIEMQSGDIWSIQYTHQYEHLTRPFEIFSGIEIPIGDYRFGAVNASYQAGQQRRVSGRLSAQHGDFYSGQRTNVGVGGRIELSSRVSLEPGFSQNWVDLAEGRFTTKLATLRAIFTPSARTALSSFLQFNSSTDTWSSNVRLRWEYSPGSELYLVYSDGRDTSVDRFPEVRTRTLALKATYLLRL